MNVNDSFEIISYAFGFCDDYCIGAGDKHVLCFPCSPTNRSMKANRFRKICVVAPLFFCIHHCSAYAQSNLAGDEGPQRPNIILLLADDLGYGDVQPLNYKSQIPTPTFIRLAKEGMTFTDAHTPSSVCTPTRYGLLTGRYCWRTSLKKGVLNGYGQPLIENDRPNLASVLKQDGYRTHVVGKWHLGLGMPEEASDIMFNETLSSHPGSLGFEYSFIIPASLDFPPYVYFRNGLATSSKLREQPSSPFPAFTRKGPVAEDFNQRRCLDRLTDETLEIIADMGQQREPSFIYFPLTAPHKPVLPNVLHTGSTSLGPYGDFVRQVDHTIGRVVEALEKHEQLDNTILIVTSDNGSFMKSIPKEEPDHLKDSAVQGFHVDNHTANSNWRGTKADIWEGGHRVPFFIRLPNAKNGGVRFTQVVGLIDIMRTITDYLDVEIPESAAPDSYSFASVLQSPFEVFQRPPLICHSAAGMFSVRLGPWKLIAGNGSGGREQPKGVPFGEPWQLKNIELDPTEQKDFADKHPEIFNDLKQELKRIKGTD